MSLLGSISSALFTPKEGGSLAGNALRAYTGTTGKMDTAVAVGNMTGKLLSGKGSSLPNIKTILTGAAKGATQTILDSDAGQQAQKQVTVDYLKANAYKFIVLGIAAVASIGAIVWAIVRLKSPKGRR